MVGKVLLFLALVGYTAAALDTCQKGGEYCLNHWDCCSKTCLSFLYKCSRIPATKAEEPVIATRFDTALTLNDIIAIAFKPVETERSSGRSRNEISSRFRRQTGSGRPSIVEVATSEQPACKAIGEKCYFDQDCCSTRCHGFLHQCVT